jgi:hypothetical protein
LSEIEKRISPTIVTSSPSSEKNDGFFGELRVKSSDSSTNLFWNLIGSDGLLQWKKILIRDVVEPSTTNDNDVLAYDAASGEWIPQSASAAGLVGGPTSSTNNAVVLWDGITGALVKDSSILSGTDTPADNYLYGGGSSFGLATGVSAGKVLKLSGYNVSGGTWTDFLTITANATASADLNSSVTIGGSYIYRTGGTDVSVSDGGTGVSSLSGLVVGNGTSPFTAVTTSAGLASVITDETGSGALVFNTSPGFITAANPSTNDGASLGTSSLGWSDLFLASGAVINFANGNFTATHSAGMLTLSGDLLVDGGDIGLTTDTDLIGLGANALTVRGTLTTTSTITVPNNVVVRGERITAGTYFDLAWVDTSDNVQLAAGTIVRNTSSNIGIGTGTSNINLTGYSGQVASLYHANLSSTLELASGRTDADAASVGTVGWAFKNNTLSSTAKQIAAIDGITDGSTANDRGGRIAFRTRSNGAGSGTGAVTRWVITSTGDFLKASSGGDIGLTTDTDLLGLSANALTVRGTLTISGDPRIGIGTSPVSNTAIRIAPIASGIGTPFYLITGFGANTSWPISLCGIYDAAYVDTYLTLNGYVDGGTRSSPTFTGGNNGGAFIRRQGDATPALEMGYYGAGSGVSGTVALSFDTSSNVKITGDLLVDGGDIGLTTDTDLLGLASNQLTVRGDIMFAGTNTTGSGSASLGSNCPAVTLSAPYTWIKVITSDGSTAYIPAWK